MKYFIGYLMQGEAAEWHKRIAKQISDTFGTWEMYVEIPPHITLFRPFEVANIDMIETFLHTWTEEHGVPGNFTLSGFNHFSDQVVFADIQAESKVLETVTDLRTHMSELLNTTEDFPDWRPHSTLAYLLTPKEITDIWDYVQKLESPHFVLPFNNVTIFRSEKAQRWEIELVLPLLYGHH